mgnify:CR=1 FL=1
MRGIQLGASLYVPALNENLTRCVLGADPNLRSMIVCLEDSTRDDEVDRAERTFAQVLSICARRPSLPFVYVRPRDPDMLGRMLKMPGIGYVDGFVLPKVTSAGIGVWLGLLERSQHSFMPTIEGLEAFDRLALSAIRDQLQSHAGRVTAVRIGGNDILGLLGVRRSRSRTAYDGPLGDAVRNIASVFLPAGMAVAAPVFEHYAALDVLLAELELDIEHGLLTKTAIHPKQIQVIQDAYRPTAVQLSEACAILAETADAVFGLHGSMCEPATHRRWAENIVQRAQVHGVAGSIGAARSLVA